MSYSIAHLCTYGTPCAYVLLYRATTRLRRGSTVHHHAALARSEPTGPPWRAHRRALQVLASKREQFAPLMVAQKGLCGNITQALDEEGKYPGITDLMSQLAVTGFAPLDKLMDPRAERLSKLHIAGGVTYQDTVIGLPEDAWLRHHDDPRRLRTHKAGLVPTSEMSRMLILLELEDAPLST